MSKRKRHFLRASFYTIAAAYSPCSVRVGQDWIVDFPARQRTGSHCDSRAKILGSMRCYILHILWLIYGVLHESILYSMDLYTILARYGTSRLFPLSSLKNCFEKLDLDDILENLRLYQWFLRIFFLRIPRSFSNGVSDVWRGMSLFRSTARVFRAKSFITSWQNSPNF